MKAFALTMLFTALLAPVLAFGQQVTWNEHSIPQIAVGGDRVKGLYMSYVTITNPSPQSTDSVNLIFRSQDGNGLPLDGWVSKEGFQNNYFSGAVVLNPGLIPSNGSATVVLTSSSLNVISASMKVLNPRTSSGSDTVAIGVRYEYTENGIVKGQAAVLPATPSTSFNFHAVRYTDENQNLVQTGIAVVNPNNSATTVACTVYDGRGRGVISAGFSLSANGQIAQFVWQLFPLPLSWTGGLVTCSSPQAVSGVTLETTTNPNGLFTFSTGYVRVP